jgi:hypothetical protein
MSTKYWVVTTVGLASILMAACVSELGGGDTGAQPCVYNGVTYQPGESFGCDCNSCQCVDGNEIISTAMWCGGAGSGGSAGPAGGSNPSGGAGGNGGGGGNGAIPATGVVPSGQTLNGFTLGWRGGFVGSPDALSTCDPRSYQNTIFVNVATSSIAWNRCSQQIVDQGLLVVHSELVQGQRPLAPEELASVLTALQGVRSGAESPCPWPDMPIKTLDVQTDRALLLYVDDQSACLASAEGRTSVVNLDGLIYALNPLVPAVN